MMADLTRTLDTVRPLLLLVQVFQPPQVLLPDVSVVKENQIVTAGTITVAVRLPPRTCLGKTEDSIDLHCLAFFIVLFSRDP